MPEPMPQMQNAPGPQAAPMAQPSQNKGNQQMGKVRATTAIQLLSAALNDLGATSPEGQAVVRALGNLTKHFGKPKDEELVPAQLAEMVRANQGGQLSQLLKQQQQPPPQGMPPGGAMPGMGG